MTEKGLRPRRTGVYLDSAGIKYTENLRAEFQIREAGDDVEETTHGTAAAQAGPCCDYMPGSARRGPSSRAFDSVNMP